MRLWKVGLIYLGIAALFFYYRTELSNWLIHQYPPIGLVFAVAVALAIFPVLPYKLIIGTLGFKYGPLSGALISWAAVSVASILLFLAARKLFRERAIAYINRFEQAERIGQMIERRPFLTIFIARLIPFFPQGLVNLYPAFLSVRLSTYIVASSLGKIPAMLLFSYLGAQLFTDWRRALLVLAVYSCAVLAAYLCYRLWFHKPTAGQ
ncbi:TVP38/TMEM64 family protein [Paenibacillus sp. GCM10012307]|uniref:TVP38/TMEM64 family membrane protein n=1 Tax=Paenibacillus roseus TaxID=2798579 RepID=A0A934J409_9BACL|nr:VTT domain-containing protein [Paenibacillus roseus]MBJ6359953.1 TVP38/TMEM64 family protein [Paenibacillus roseus]